MTSGDGTGPFLWLAAKGSSHGFHALPPGGLCLSSFLFVRRGGEILLGKYGDDAPTWARLTGLDEDRVRAHKNGWTLPARHLKLGEDPRDAARRIARDVLAMPDLALEEPRVVTFFGAPRRFPDLPEHYDVCFLHEARVAPATEAVAPAWYAELAWHDPKTLPASAYARSHDEVVTAWRDAPSASLAMRALCERCDARLAPDAADAFVCSYECTFCAACARAMAHVCPNCGGELVARPRRMAA
ncbi:MAG: DUF1272 domain-containing protein [Thermoplasmatota archaeon]